MDSVKDLRYVRLSEKKAYQITKNQIQPYL